MRHALFLSCSAVLVGSLASPSWSQQLERLSEWSIVPVRDAQQNEYGAFRSGFALELTSDALEDVVVLAGDRARMLVNAGSWGIAYEFPPLELCDIAPFPRGSSATNAILAVGSAGLSLHRWSGAAMDVELIVPPGAHLEWNSLERVACGSLHELGIDAALVVAWDPSTSLLHPLLLAQRWSPSPQAPTPTSWMNPFPVPDLLALHLADYDNDSLPDIVVAHTGGLTVFDLAGSVIASRQVLSSRALLTSYRPTQGAAARIAWTSTVGTTSTLRVIGQSGDDGPVTLRSVNPVSVALGSYDGDSRPDLAFNDADRRRTVIYRNRSGSATTFRDAPESIVIVDTADLAALPCAAQPILADLDADGFADLIQFEEEIGAAHLLARNTVLEVDNPLGLLMYHGVSQNEDVLESIFLMLSVEDSDPEVTDIVVIVWSWIDFDTRLLEPDPLGVLVVNDIPDETQYLMLEVPLQLPPQGLPELYAVEVRALHSNGDGYELLAVLNFVQTEDCDIFAELLELIPDEYEEFLGDECEDDPMGGGVYVGGIVRVPRLPRHRTLPAEIQGLPE